MIFAGVDPGLEGAMALLSTEGRVLSVGPTPTIQASKADGGNRYELAAIARTLLKWANHDQLVVTVEKLRALPATRRDAATGQLVQLGGFQTNLHRGEARGWWWMVAGLRAAGYRIALLAVEPQEWQRELVKGLPAGSNKERSLKAAALEFPGVSLRRSPRHRVDDHGIAEALLLAELGRRRYLGGRLFARA